MVTLDELCASVCKEHGEFVEKPGLYTYKDSGFLIDYIVEDEKILLSKKKAESYFILFVWKDGEKLIDNFLGDKDELFNSLYEIKQNGDINGGSKN